MPTAKQPSKKVSQHAVLLRLIDELKEQFEMEYVDMLLEEFITYTLTNEHYARDHAGTEIMYDHISLFFKLRKIMAALLKLQLHDLDKVLDSLDKS